MNILEFMLQKYSLLDMKHWNVDGIFICDKEDRIILTLNTVEDAEKCMSIIKTLAMHVDENKFNKLMIDMPKSTDPQRSFCRVRDTENYDNETGTHPLTSIRWTSNPLDFKTSNVKDYYDLKLNPDTIYIGTLTLMSEAHESIQYPSNEFNIYIVNVHNKYDNREFNYKDIFIEYVETNSQYEQYWRIAAICLVLPHLEKMCLMDYEANWRYKIAELTVERLLNETPTRDIVSRLHDVVDKLNDITKDDLCDLIKD